MSTPFAIRLRLAAGVLTLLGATLTSRAQTLEAGTTQPAASAAQAQFITGNVRTPDGPVSGASIRLTGPGLVSVTNENGDFYFPMPHGTGPQAAVVSYTGGADVALTLAPGNQPSPLEVPAAQLTSQQQRALNKAMKYGRRQGRKDSRHLR